MRAKIVSSACALIIAISLHISVLINSVPVVAEQDTSTPWQTTALGTKTPSELPLPGPASILVNNKPIGALASAGGAWQYPLPQGRDLNSIKFIDVNSGWAVGDGGIIVHTIDGGAHWSLQNSGVTNSLNAVAFTDKNNGWAVGSYMSSCSSNCKGAIVHTADGGLNWQEQQLPVSTSNYIQLSTVVFVDANNGWIGGYVYGSSINSYLLHTTDGGANWSIQETFSSNSGADYVISSIVFLNATIGWMAVTDKGIYSTVDGGQTWNLLASTTGWSVTDIAFGDGQTGWVVDGLGYTGHTTDGGITWQWAPVFDHEDFYHVVAIDAHTAWRFGFEISHTSDGINWSPQPGPAPLNLTGASFVDASNGWAVGHGGLIIHTNNGGMNWTIQGGAMQGWDGRMTAVAAIDSDTAVGVTAEGDIIRTTDGGNTWHPVTSPTGVILEAISFVSPTLGWAVGDDNTIIRTSDGGMTWSIATQTPGDYDHNLNRMRFVDGSNGWVWQGLWQGGGFLKHTTDGGNTWASSPFSGIAASFIDRNNGWAVEVGGNILRTTDAGSHWVVQSTVTNTLGSFNGSLTDVSFADSNYGWISGLDSNGGLILFTANGGVTWTEQVMGDDCIPQTNGSSLMAPGLTFINSSTGWMSGKTASGQGCILKTTDSGAHWTSAIIVDQGNTGGGIGRVSFADTSHGWALIAGRLIHTADGGGTWSRQADGELRSYKSVSFVGPYNGWATGDDGTILHTDDGGVNWRRQFTGITETVSSISFVDSLNGWAISSGGGSQAILHTSDGGITWSHQNPGTAQALSKLQFIDRNDGWAVGNGGTIIHSSDGGLSWLPQNSGTNGDLYSVAFANSNVGWAVGGGSILRYDDGNWTPVLTGTIPLYSVATVSGAEAWAVGAGYEILHTSDSGANWSSRSLPASSWEYAGVGVAFADQWRGIAVTSINDCASCGPSIISSTSDGGSTWQTQWANPAQLAYGAAIDTSGQYWVVGENAILSGQLPNTPSPTPTPQAAKIFLPAIMKKK